MEFKRFEALIEMFPQVQIFSTDGEDLDRVITHFLNQRDNVSTMSEAMQRKIQQALAPFFQQRFISLHDSEAPLVRNLLLNKKFFLQTDRYIDDVAWPETDPAKLDDALKIADLSEGILERKLLSLSNGELRRVLLARMWMENPEWIYFNDLFGGLDPEYRAHLAGCVADLARSKGGSLKIAVRLAREDELLPEIPAFVYAGKTFTAYEGDLPKCTAKPKYTKAELKDYEIVLLGDGGLRRHDATTDADNAADNAAPSSVIPAPSSVIPAPSSVIPAKAGISVHDNAADNAAPSSVIPAPSSVIPAPSSVIPAKAGISVHDNAADNAAPSSVIPAPSSVIPAKAGISVHDNAEILFDLKNINIRFGETDVIKNLNWTVRKGEHWAVMGENGAGKSTLLGLLTADHPQIYNNDIMLLGERPGHGLNIWDHKAKLGFFSPELALQYREDLSLLEVLCTGFTPNLCKASNPTWEEKAKAREWLKYLGFEDVNQNIRTLSPIDKRLVLMARASIRPPKVLLLDEPSQGLKGEYREKLFHLLQLLSTETTLILVSHYEEEWPPCITHLLRMPKFSLN